MKHKPFIIQTANEDECREALIYLDAVGYGLHAKPFVSYATDYKGYLFITVHCSGDSLNTRPSLAQAQSILGPRVKPAQAFPTFRAFLTSNRNVKFDGQPMAHLFSS